MNKICLKIVAVARGGHGGHLSSPVVGSTPLYPNQVQKWQKSAILGKFLDFCHLEIHCSLNTTHKQFSGAATVYVCILIGNIAIILLEYITYA